MEARRGPAGLERALAEGLSRLPRLILKVTLTASTALASVMLAGYATSGERGFLAAAILVLAMIPVDAVIMKAVMLSSAQSLATGLARAVLGLRPTAVSATPAGMGALIAATLEGGRQLHVYAELRRIEAVLLESPIATRLPHGKPRARLKPRNTTPTQTRRKSGCRDEEARGHWTIESIEPATGRPALIRTHKAWYTARTCKNTLTQQDAREVIDKLLSLSSTFNSRLVY